jgi:dihydrofolate reductase
MVPPRDFFKVQAGYCNFAGTATMSGIMDRSYSIEGLAIISADGMLADTEGVMPDALKVEGDQQFFHGSLDRADIVVHGRHSHEGGPNAKNRRRMIVTRRINGFGPHPENPNAFLWNPAGASFETALHAFGGAKGMVAVIGGTNVFGLFLTVGYDKFHLTRANDVRLPAGRPVFPGVPARSPEDVLRHHGLKPSVERMLDAQRGVSLVTWL